MASRMHQHLVGNLGGKPVEARLSFFTTMSQVGVTAFALMFAAAQFRMEQWAYTATGKATMFSSLFELFSATTVALAVSSQIYSLWNVTSIACGTIGLAISAWHLASCSRHWRKLQTAERVQFWLNFLPFVSYGTLLLVAAFNARGSEIWGANDPAIALAITSVVCIWFIVSGSFESYLTLCPSFLLPEPLPDSPSGKQSVAGQASKNQATVRKA